jgi:septal ring factor EnvC (AmiA/AmiB activator)
MAEVEAAVDLDRPVSLREFDARFEDTLSQINKRFDKLEEEMEKDKKAQRLLADEIEKFEMERADAWKKLVEGNVLEFLRKYYNVKKGDDSCVIRRLKGE